MSAYLLLPLNPTLVQPPRHLYVLEQEAEGTTSSSVTSPREAQSTSGSWHTSWYNHFPILYVIPRYKAGAYSDTQLRPGNRAFLLHCLHGILDGTSLVCTVLLCGGGGNDMNWTDCEPAESRTTSAHLQESAWPQMGSPAKGTELRSQRNIELS